MTRMAFTWVAAVLAVLAGARQLAAAPITGTVDIFLDGGYSGGSSSVWLRDSGLFGNVPTDGAITEVATSVLEVPANTIPWEQVYAIPVPLPVYQDATSASIDDVFFTIVPEASSLRYEGGQTFELTYSGGTNIDVFRTLNYGAPLFYGTFKFVIKVWAIRTVPSLAVEAPGVEGRALSQNHPNPFRSPTSIVFDVPRAGHVRLEVIDVSGKRVAVLVDRSMGVGSHIAHWDGRDESGTRMRPGQYLYRLATDQHLETRKMTLLD